MNKKSPWWPEEREAWKPPDEITVSQCADRYRVLSTKSAKPGKWETSFVPFMREIQDSFALDCVEEIWFVKPTQIGGTECLLNMILYAVMQDPGPAMLVEPNEDLANEISQDRIDEMVRTCDALREVQSHDADDSTKKKKTFSSMTLYLAWAGSPSSLASRPIRILLFDEVNKYPEFSGKESSPLALGKERTNTFVQTRKICYVSTPTTENGYITANEKKNDCRFRFHVACPLCGHEQIFIFAQVKFGENHDPRVVEDSAWYECEKCGKPIREDSRMEMVRRGKWVDIKSGLEFPEAIETLNPKSIGFQITRLYSPWHSFGAVAAEFLRCKDDPSLLMNFYNSWLAEEWIERIHHKTTDQILAHKTLLEPLTVPEGTIAMTAGIDPGQGGFWFAVLAWLHDLGIHLVHYGFFLDPMGGGGWDLAQTLLLENSYPGANGMKYPIWRAGIDTGGSEYDDKNETMTEAAYNFLRKLGSKRVFGTKGMTSHMGIHRMKITVIDKMPGKNSRPIPGGLSLWLVDTDIFKDVLHYRLQVKPGDPGGISLHSETGEDFARHILAEEKRRKRDGTSEWVTVSTTNHLLDCTLLALAMGDTECWGGVRVLQRPQCLPAETILQAPGTKSPNQPQPTTGRRVISGGIL